LLESQHQEILDLGFRAVFSSVYHPAATQPRTVAVLAGVLGLTGLVLMPWKAKEGR
jgi:hypothetical protein